jgi:hypothetical protein
MESWAKGGFTKVSPFSTAGVTIYKESDDKCQAIELMNLLHSWGFIAGCIQFYINSEKIQYLIAIIVTLMN